MSKIEQALGRAKQTSSVRLVSVNTPSTTRELANTKSENQTISIESRAIAVQEIRRMRDSERKSSNELAENQTIHSDLNENEAVAALRELRTKILRQCNESNGVIVVTSVVPGGGGSFIARNLAAAFAFDPSRTSLLIDCNLRASTSSPLHSDLHQPGLTDFLEDTTIDINSIIHPAGIDRLRYIPAGGKRETPREYFVSDRMSYLLNSVRNRYRERFVFLDAPPLTESADIQTLIESADHVLVVVPYAAVSLEEIDAALKTVPVSKLLGVVFNDKPSVPPSITSTWLGKLLFKWRK